MIRLELQHIIKNKFLLFMYIVMPLFVGFFIYASLAQSIITKMPIGIIDLDNSQISRDITFKIDSASGLSIKRRYASLLEAKDDLDTKQIYAIVVLPHNLQKNIKTNISPDIAVYYNAQLVFIGKNIQSTLLQVFSNTNITLRFAKHIADTKNTTLSMGKSIDSIPKISALYNQNSNFTQFLFTIILPCSWQLFIILCMISLMTKIDSKVDIMPQIWAKILINTIIFFIWWIIMNLVFYELHYPNDGNMWILALNAIVLILAYNSIGIFIYALITSHTRAISIAAVYAAPSLAFVGITYPINSMGTFASFWSSILPITRYLQVYLQQTSYGIDWIYSMNLIAQNLPFLLFGIVGIIIYKRKQCQDS